MSEFVIYHNARCSKSRKALEILTQNNIKPKVINYLEDGLTEKELSLILSLLDLEASSLVRSKEKEFIDSPFDLNGTSEIVRNLIKTPKLLQRPIVIKDDRAVIGRPVENVLQLIQ